MTDFLFAMPNFIEGMGRAIDLGNTMTHYNTSLTPEEADRRALYNDWAVVGQEIRKAANHLTSNYVK
jgi:hypothetical protein